MDVELIEIQEFLAKHPPFEQLPVEALEQLPRQFTVRYLRRGTRFPPADDQAQHLYILRRGAIELRDAEGELVGKLAEGDLFSDVCLSSDNFGSDSDSDSSSGSGSSSGSSSDAKDAKTKLSGETVEDSLLYSMTCAQFEQLRSAHPEFADHFDGSTTKRLRKALDVFIESSAATGGLMTVSARDLLRRKPIMASPRISIREAASLMSAERVSALLLMEQDRLSGIITDRDLRNRCVATGLSTDQPVSEIMTAAISTIDADALGFEALLQMTRLNVHHLPVVDGKRLLGMLSTSDFTRFQSTSGVYLVGDIHKAESLAALETISAKVPELQVQLISSGATGGHVGQAVSAITDAITKRLLELAEAELGPPPVPYAWLVGGSQARREQSSHSDQDNALLIADGMSKDDDRYFRQLAERVNDGLNACGYIYCPGEVMAKTANWRQPLATWRQYFDDWINRPDPKALMLASVFFDLRALHDPAGLFDGLHEQVLELSRSNRIFIAHMAANALKHRPPLGFFRNFVLIRGGDHNHTFDIKHRGTVPIIDLARVYALSTGLAPINTIERLEAAAETAALTHDGSANLIDAFELINTLRIRHQASQLRNGEKADNFLAPEQLSPLERGHLKDAFLLIDRMQETLGQRYQAGRFG
ncbi:MAG: putative nucleotidyltransferase substrate binding domain-containing protein [Lamprobacter sp.]|uniref:putative nucleotidyltransferase substrate binding domain-containing protein n=1 Tax=Lamprobacter sp. TaxID=3100796 RepID=UPI002B263385|nr:putative nucleotidyltransferase substrate binding domain-containing protein [Lamprobacter sp.]MEA3640479.1 putative nucleotidyltransferase substrate binding domain-containing protein [Lamprobacter sp.]